MTDWLDSYRARQMAEAEDRAAVLSQVDDDPSAVARIVAGPLGPSAVCADRGRDGVVSIIVAALAVYNAPEIVRAMGW